ncbi:MAG: phage portal protein [Planctomycetaceae bacterium]|nr:phage portal protein [Planctomycetaceae bacterium]
MITSDWNQRLLEKAALLERSLAESFFDGTDRFVDPSEAYIDGGEYWRPIRNTTDGISATPFDENYLNEIRNQSRNLVLTNEFAINAIENRINYIVGSGHRYHAVPVDENDLEISGQVQDFLVKFLDENQWAKRHQEIVRRRDRDGEVFLRFFVRSDGMTHVRFVEPGQVSCPQEYLKRQEHSFGIHTEPFDVESVLGYWIDGEYVSASEIQHRKSNVDFNVKRGLPLLFPVRKNFRRIEKLLRNMSIVAEIQSAIALVRKHTEGTAESIRRYSLNQGNDRTYDPLTGQLKNVQVFSPGTIIDTYSGTDYQFPVAAIDASRYILILQAELRAIAARLVIPEFMLTSDASNANYSSTMVAEGPAVRMFERLQYDTITDDLAVLHRVVEAGIAYGTLPRDTFNRVQLHAIPPILSVRDRLKEARADEILLRSGVLSAHTMSMRHGLDPNKESKLRHHCDCDCQCQ